MRNKLAVVFDFDDTLTNDSTSALLLRSDFSQEKIDKFWRKDVARLVSEDGWEETNAWLYLLLNYMKEGRVPWMTNEELKAFGNSLVPYEGLKEFLDDLRVTAEKAWCEVEFYIISGGIQDIIEGFPLRKEFKAVWGCRLAPDAPNGKVHYVKRAITFTEKTRYLFVIN
jgi:2-hydroxy-3-keto-5-methylthiopentenyl-1-phosphate phosphatase